MTGEASADAWRVDEALGDLSVDQRAILVLHHLDGRPLNELAAILDIPIGTAKSRLFAARRSLATALARDEGRGK
jgi:RNA polymerase sigma-70 factor (ECF subfamily)